MTDTTADKWHFAETAKEEIELPAPVPFSTPILITDCVTPLAGETILSLLWKRLDDQP